MIWWRDVLIIGLIVGLSIPLGRYLAAVMTGQKVWLSVVFQPVEKRIYRFLGYPDTPDDMTGRQFVVAIVALSAISLAVVMGVLMTQQWLPFNPNHVHNVPWDLALNTAMSFVTNTDWQAYSGETAMSYLSQFMVLTTQNFVSAAVGVAGLLAVIRGFSRKESATIGNFWVDVTRFTLYVLVPLSVVLTLLIVSQGGVQNFAANHLVQGTLLPSGPASSQFAISLLGSNGGGFFGANAGALFHNPTGLSNLFESVAIVLLPAGLVVMFGQMVGRRQAFVLYAVMLGILVLAIIGTTLSELHLGQHVAGVAGSTAFEGKNVVNGIGLSALWNTLSTAVSNGSVNASLDSFTPLGGLIPMLLMQLGEIVFGGVGSGLYGMLSFVLLTVFISGLMVGRTPEYLGKKIAAYDMKMVSLAILLPPVLTLTSTAIAVSWPGIGASLTNTGAHGFSEILYAFSSMGNNNGSSFGGFNGNQLMVNVVGAVLMGCTRFVPLIAMVCLGANLAKKKQMATSSGTLRTDTGLFAVLLLFIILLIGALNFVPALVLGPIADFLTAR
ncbi:potassium-transporting ATPase subunit KdpA [Leuconostoc holzapfelii]|uniref:Potassium-transporting ATPase potassium-binding subunit n=1 Tax=Leuconostoc holzapfelii TaxID=434464 RepID=A0ABT2NX44_9LACO|nr:potassium-transporting ATPase subunit KdpA [Leuconostoc holzapfelii]MCT8389948.1 potassium-transporting ATPase subunit KdpA [Leuconostoc holzapfelii]